MNCSDAQSQMYSTNVQGQTLADILSHNYKTQYLTEPAQQTGPYATAGETTQSAAGSYTAGGAEQQATSNQYMPITPTTQPAAMTLESLQYLNGALRTQIGRKVTIDFLIGTNTLVDKTGTLLAVGANYLIINEIETDDLLFCDYYSIKFVKVYR